LLHHVLGFGWCDKRKSIALWIEHIALLMESRALLMHVLFRA